MNAQAVYTFSQILNQYYPEEEGRLQTLRSLCFVSKSAYEGGADRFKKEECTYSIRKKEFFNYFNNKLFHKVAVFIYSDSATFSNMKIIFIDYHSYYKYYVEGFYKEENSLKRLHETISKEIYNKNDIFKLVQDQTNYHPKHLNYFGSRHVKITFDLLTLYDILNKRGQCVKIIKGYVRNFILRTFEDFIRDFGSHPKNIPILNFYLYYNANVLNINQCYTALLESYSNLQLCIDKTKPFREELILKIRKKILELK
jgi:hypothetical protein